jgi:two-component system, NarL family, response regulator DevR
MHERTRSSAMLKIFLVDDSPLVRQRIAALVGAIKGIEIVGEAEDAGNALSGIAATDADVVLWICD